MFKRTLPYVLLTLLCLLLYLPGITTLPMIDRDSAHYAQASRQMLESHNYFQVNFQNKPRYQKPPGIYWLQAASVKLFSNPQSTKAWPYRLPSLLGALLAVLLTYAFASTILGRKIAFLGAALLASSLLLVVEAHMAITDAALLATMVLMQGALWKVYITHRTGRVSYARIVEKLEGIKLYPKTHPHQKQGWFYPMLFWFAMALGIVIKGITPLVGFLTIFGICILDRNFSWIKKLKPVWGILLVLVMSSWLLIVSLASKSNFLYQMIHTDVAPKLVGGQESHGAPPGYYLILFTLTFWPASLFIWHAGIWAWRNRKYAVERFLIIWILPTWIFYALVPTKLPQYALPLYPAIALLAALGIYFKEQNPLSKVLLILTRISYITWALFGIGLACTIFLLPHYLSNQYSIVASFSAAIILLTTILGVVLAFKQKLRAAAAAVIIGAVISYASIFQTLLPSQKNLWLSNKISAAIQKHAPNAVTKQRPLLACGYHEPSLVFMLGTHKVVLTYPANAAQNLVDHPNQLVLIKKDQLPSLQKYAQQKQVSLKHLATIKGYNYSRSQWVTLLLLQGKNKN